MPDNVISSENLTLARSFMPGDVDSVRATISDDKGKGKGNTLFGHFSVFNRWTEIDSFFEGHFMERIGVGAHAADFAARGDKIKPIYGHGKDPDIGFKPLGPVEELRETDTGGYYEVNLIDTYYNRDFIIPAAKAGVLGASFRFRPLEGSDVWNNNPERSNYNPNGIPEVTHTAIYTVEFGPTNFPAYSEASAGLRSIPQPLMDELVSAMVQRLRAEGLVDSGKSHAGPQHMKDVAQVINDELHHNRYKAVRQVMLDNLFLFDTVNTVNKAKVS